MSDGESNNQHVYYGLSRVIENTVIPELLEENRRLKKGMEELENLWDWVRPFFCRKCYVVGVRSGSHWLRNPVKGKEDVEIFMCGKCNSKLCQKCSIKYFSKTYADCVICEETLCSLCDPLVLEDGQDLDKSGWICTDCLDS